MCQWPGANGGVPRVHLNDNVCPCPEHLELRHWGARLTSHRFSSPQECGHDAHTGIARTYMNIAYADFVNRMIRTPFQCDESCTQAITALPRCCCSTSCKEKVTGMRGMPRDTFQELPGKLPNGRLSNMLMNRQVLSQIIHARCVRHHVDAGI